MSVLKLIGSELYYFILKKKIKGSEIIYFNQIKLF